MNSSRRDLESCLPITRRAACAFASAHSEAESLFRLIGSSGKTADTLRELIAIPPRELSILQSFAERSPQLSHRVERAIEFGRKCWRNLIG